MATTLPAGAVASFLQDLYLPVADDLVDVERILREELRSKIPFVEELTARVRLYQGKRLRPALLLLSAKASGRIRPDHHVLGAVVEMIHVATLVHDDILDEAATRRHVTTVNAEWGDEASVLLGDYLFTHAFHLAASLESTAACRLIGKATNRVCEGELHQVSRRGAFDLSEVEYLDMLEGKTAALIACCTRLGATFAGAAPVVVEALDQYGRELGIAFQIADDLLDLLGDEQETGKTAGSDLLKRKATLPLIRFREVADPRALARCRKLFDHPDSTSRRDFAQLLGETDAIRYSQQMAARLASQASARLSILPPSQARDILSFFARFAVERSA